MSYVYNDWSQLTDFYYLTIKTFHTREYFIFRFNKNAKKRIYRISDYNDHIIMIFNRIDDLIYMVNETISLFNCTKYDFICGEGICYDICISEINDSNLPILKEHIDQKKFDNNNFITKDNYYDFMLLFTIKKMNKPNCLVNFCDTIYNNSNDITFKYVIKKNSKHLYDLESPCGLRTQLFDNKIDIKNEILRRILDIIQNKIVKVIHIIPSHYGICYDDPLFDNFNSIRKYYIAIGSVYHSEYYFSSYDHIFEPNCVTCQSISSQIKNTIDIIILPYITFINGILNDGGSSIYNLPKDIYKIIVPIVYHIMF